ncbi:MAG: efflux RND transporter periplasmic adaptor subunit, partial [Gammaproteobacteria bacterium]|nr:efflux RND transporter periplasmic adaptor subunit [Gammaproteobacteria bacterium]
MNKLKNRQYLILIVILATILLVLLLKWTEPEKIPDMKPLPMVRVELFEVKTKDIAFGKSLLGRLTPLRRTELRFEVNGRMQARFVEPGDKVKKGQVLLKIDDGDYRNLLSEENARILIEHSAIRRDQELLKLASQNRILQQKEVKRLQRLVKKSLTSISKLDAARQQLFSLKLDEANLQYSVDSSAARLDIRLSALEKAERNLQRASLVSPWPGIINQVYVQPGDYVTPAKAVIEIIDNSVLEFMITVQGEIADQLNKNLAVDVTVNGAKVKGEIVALQTDPDPATFTHEVRVRLPENIGYPGQVVEAYLTLPALEDALTIPVTALLYENKKYFVM